MLKDEIIDLLLNIKENMLYAKGKELNNEQFKPFLDSMPSNFIFRGWASVGYLRKHRFRNIQTYIEKGMSNFLEYKEIEYIPKKRRLKRSSPDIKAFRLKYDDETFKMLFNNYDKKGKIWDFVMSPYFLQYMQYSECLLGTTHFALFHAVFDPKISLSIFNSEIIPKRKKYNAEELYELILANTLNTMNRAFSSLIIPPRMVSDILNMPKEFEAKIEKLEKEGNAPGILELANTYWQSAILPEDIQKKYGNLCQTIQLMLKEALDFYTKQHNGGKSKVRTHKKRYGV